ncbi:MAG: efflux RND transporter periplasmic adaptor subunit [Candidatus Kapabacteria bacterium]|nr:efflux RND transporter periplasmic adaptor subunit [Candidatus Kapabacteria bacterium]
MKNNKTKWIIIAASIIVLIAASISIYYVFIKKSAAQVHNVDAHKDIYTCPMHPQIQVPNPGVCPICFMELIKQNGNANSGEDIGKTIKLTNNKLILANVSTIRVYKEDIRRQIVAYSSMEFADQNRRVISARFNGRIEKLFVNKTGDQISKGQALFEVYSPDIVQAQNELLIAMDGKQNMSALINSARRKLQLFGLTDDQIKEIEDKREVMTNIKYHSPASGIVIEKKVQEGIYVNEGMTLFDIADMSELWNIAEIYETDLSAVSVGNSVKLMLQAYPGETYSGKVSFIYPVVNSQSRTVKIRSDISNAKGKLKPQMYGQTIFEHNYGRGLLIPAEAIIFLGRRNVVWIKKGEGEFEAREVVIGMKLGDKYQVLSGLEEGDEIAKTGGYLIDSESQLKTGAVTDPKNMGNGIQAAVAEPEKKEKVSKNPEDSPIFRKGIIDLQAIDKNKDSKVFQSPMHFNVIDDKPGKCVVCGMLLEEVTIKKAKEVLVKNGFKVK